VVIESNTEKHEKVLIKNFQIPEQKRTLLFAMPEIEV
jgi:hypothetical protein